MPQPAELASLGLPPALGGEDPLTAVAGSTSSSSRRDPCKVVPSSLHSRPSYDPGETASNSLQLAGLSLSHGFPLIPPKLVGNILKWEYVDISELLPDNLELARRTAEAQRSLATSCSSKAPKKRELTKDLKGLAAWSVCFSTYIAIISKEHPEKFQELLAYHATILIEALRFGCKGWLAYDRMFREHIEKEPSSSWSMLHPMFYSLSFLSQRVEALTCPKCMAPDHSKSECALSSLEPIQEQSRSQPPTAGRQFGLPRKRFWREGTPTPATRAKVSYCFSYNEGQCFHNPKPCDREHRCIRCGKEHRMVDCTASFVPSTSA